MSVITGGTVRREPSRAAARSPSGPHDRAAPRTRVVVMRAEDEVTPTETAKLMGVTRQFVDRLGEDGLLAFRCKPSNRDRRIHVEDVLEVAAERK